MSKKDVNLQSQKTGVNHLPNSEFLTFCFWQVLYVEELTYDNALEAFPLKEGLRHEEKLPLKVAILQPLRHFH